MYSDDPRMQAELNLQRGGYTQSGHIQELMSGSANEKDNQSKVPSQGGGGSVALSPEQAGATGVTHPSKLSDSQLEAEIAALRGQPSNSQKQEGSNDGRTGRAHDEGYGTPFPKLTGSDPVIKDINQGYNSRNALGLERGIAEPESQANAGDSELHPILATQQSQLDEVRAKKEALEKMLEH
ncbi:MAG: hypothetical protein CYPHOPRED_005926 [Cyphobasidiales sp. Tagirdzhanova-0007]|nr:MAG: hypothetical protein CYPHOPRED_005926 [Cyphobasidiales sp. Tagirdzhanova-0007]